MLFPPNLNSIVQVQYMYLNVALTWIPVHGNFYSIVLESVLS